MIYDLKSRIFENILDKVTSLYNKPVRKYGIRFRDNKAQVFSYSQHRTKLGIQYRKLVKVRYSH